MPGVTAIGVHDQLSPGQAGIGGGAALHKAPGGVDIKLCFVINHPGGERGKNYMGNQTAAQLINPDVCLVLGGKNHRGNPDGPVLFILHRNLRLPVRQQEGKLPVATNQLQPANQRVGQLNGQRHQVFRLLAGKAKHHALIAGACVQPVFLRPTAVYAPGNVRRLAVKIHRNPAVLRVKTALRLCIADLCNHLPCQLLAVDFRIRGNFTENVDLIGAGGDFTGDVRFRVLS